MTSSDEERRGNSLMVLWSNIVVLRIVAYLLPGPWRVTKMPKPQ